MINHTFLSLKKERKRKRRKKSSFKARGKWDCFPVFLSGQDLVCPLSEPSTTSFLAHPSGNAAAAKLRRDCPPVGWSACQGFAAEETSEDGDRWLWEQCASSLFGVKCMFSPETRPLLLGLWHPAGLGTKKPAPEASQVRPKDFMN